MTYPSGLPHTLGSLRASNKYQNVRSVKDELRENLICKLEKKAGAVSRHRGLRRHRGAAGGERGALEAQLHSAGPARAGEDAPDPHADDAAR